MSAVDLLIAASVLALAAFILVRAFRRGGCAGCHLSRSCSRGAQEAERGLVRLGRPATGPGRPGSDGDAARRGRPASC